MAKTLKRAIALMLVLGLVLSLAACGSGTGTGTGNQNVTGNGKADAKAFDTDAFIASMPSELNGTTVEFLTWYNIQDAAAEWANIQAFEEATGINVEVITPEYKLYTETLAGLVATGSSPDVIRMSEPRAAWMKTLQPIVNTGYDFSDPAWNTDVKELFSVNGIQYAANLSYTPYVLFNMMLYDEAVFSEWGFEDPWELWKKGEWTWEKVSEMSQEWIKQGPDYYGFGTVSFDMPAATAGLDFVKYDGKQWSLDLYNVEVLDVWKQIVEDRENRITVQGTNTNFGAVKSKALFGYSNSQVLEKYSPSGVSKLEKRGTMGVVPAPKFEGKDYYMPVGELLAWGVPIGAKNPKAVPYFISWYANLAKYDLDAFFDDEHAQEVFTELVNFPNRFVPMSSEMFQFDSNPFVWHLYNNAASSQISTFIQAQEYRCQDMLNQYNDVLNNMNTEIK